MPERKHKLPDDDYDLILHQLKKCASDLMTARELVEELGEPGEQIHGVLDHISKAMMWTWGSLYHAVNRDRGSAPEDSALNLARRIEELIEGRLAGWDNVARDYPQALHSSDDIGMAKDQLRELRGLARSLKQQVRSETEPLLESYVPEQQLIHTVEVRP
jgi:hypothetical protein